jgi:hypothetical protein
MTEVEVIQGGVLKVGDTGPSLRLRLINEDGDPENIDGFTQTLNVKKSDADSNAVDAESMTILDAETGIVEYDWQSGDTAEAGVYEAEVKSTDGTDTISYPNDHFFRVNIMEDLS